MEAFEQETSLRLAFISNPTISTFKGFIHFRTESTFNLNLISDDIFNLFDSPEILNLLAAIVDKPFECPDPTLLEPFKSPKTSNSPFLDLYLRIYKCNSKENFESAVNYIASNRGGDVIWKDPLCNTRDNSNGTANSFFYAGITGASTPDDRAFEDKYGLSKRRVKLVGELSYVQKSVNYFICRIPVPAETSPYREAAK